MPLFGLFSSDDSAARKKADDYITATFGGSYISSREGERVEGRDPYTAFFVYKQGENAPWCQIWVYDSPNISGGIVLHPFNK